MIIDYEANAHSVYLLQYHLILVIKYRHKILNDLITNRLKNIFKYISINYNIVLKEFTQDLHENTCITKKHQEVIFSLIDNVLYNYQEGFERAREYVLEEMREETIFFKKR